MGKTFKGETQIRIPEDTLVLICGSQNSGKTTFTRKHFAGKSIITTDEIFEEVVKNQSTVLDTMETLASRTTDIFEERVKAEQAIYSHLGAMIHEEEKKLRRLKQRQNEIEENIRKEWEKKS